MNCALSDVYSRFADSKAHWDDSLNAYFKPSQFRRHLQACIVALRSVTFILQSNKSSIPGFDIWYAREQDAMRANLRLRWLVETRNSIEKQSDLRASSVFNVTTHSSWVNDSQENLALDIDTEPELIVSEVLKRNPKLGMHGESVVKLSRRWCSDDFNGEDILRTVEICAEEIYGVIHRAHALLSCEACSADAGSVRQSDGFVRWMRDEISDDRVIWFKPSQMKFEKYDNIQRTVLRSDPDLAVVEARYGRFPTVENEKYKSDRVFSLALVSFEAAKVLLRKDGHARMTCIIISPQGPSISQVSPSDRPDKHVMIRELARKCREEKATACILIGEAWTTAYPIKSGVIMRDSPEKGEVLTMSAIKADGGFLDVYAFFHRRADGVQFDDMEVSELYRDGGLITPLYNAITGRGSR